MHNANRKVIGKLAENIADTYLQSQGLQSLEVNYYCKMGEIDLIMKDNDAYVFVEVRHRKEDDYGDGLESITRSKQNKIIRTATHYLLEKKIFDRVDCRFDVISIGGNLHNPEILWIKDGFWVKY